MTFRWESAGAAPDSVCLGGKTAVPGRVSQGGVASSINPMEVSASRKGALCPEMYSQSGVFGPHPSQSDAEALPLEGS